MNTINTAQAESKGAWRRTQTWFGVTIEIAAPPALVWPVMADVEHWSEWTPSISRIKLLTPGPLSVGSRARVHQPCLPPAWWHVTELEPGTQFTWVSIAPGLRVTARHATESCASGSRVTLSIDFAGFLGALAAHWTRDLTRRYLALEANGLGTRCAAPSA
jgi:hypothetical protein